MATGHTIKCHDNSPYRCLEKMAEALVSKWPQGSNKKSAQEARTSKSKTESSEMKMTPARGKNTPKMYVAHRDTQRTERRSKP
jgi:hypothetical protein